MSYVLACEGESRAEVSVKKHKYFGYVKIADFMKMI